MADVNARREARRRRILENSGNRLRKITGRNDPDEIKGKYNKYLEAETYKIKYKVMPKNYNKHMFHTFCKKFIVIKRKCDKHYLRNCLENKYNIFCLHYQDVPTLCI